MADAPLSGRTIVVTRPREQAEPLAAALEGLGADVVLVPLVEIAPVDDPAALDAAASALGSYDRVVFTSANGVVAFGDRLARADVPPVAVVGPATAAAVREFGVEPALVGRGTGEDLAADLDPVAGARVLLLQADIADPELSRALREGGASVDVVTAYRTVLRGPPDVERTALRDADAIVLASGSAACSLAAAGGPGGALVVCIGPKTARVAREVGLSVGPVAEEATAEGIIRALVEHYEGST